MASNSVTSYRSKILISMIRMEEFVATNHFLNQYWHFIVKLFEWSFFYFLSAIGFGYGWILFLATLYYIKTNDKDKTFRNTSLPKSLAEKSIPERELLSKELTVFPSWVAFPDFNRVEWINDIIRKLWPNISSYATYFVKEYIEPHINEILDRMMLEKISRFQVKKIVLGTVPAYVGGIKVYPKNTSRDEIVMDWDVSYCGDARVVFTIQGISAEIIDINFRGLARVTLKPLLNSFPFVGGFDFFFLSKPTLDYTLGGVASGGEFPGVKTAIKTIVDGEIRSRFVWPNKFQVILPIDDVEILSSKSFLLPKPSGILSMKISRGRNLIAKDGHFMGSGKSDPYVVVSLGSQAFNFRDRYVSKTVDPEWNYIVENILLEDYCGQSVSIEVFDHDKTNDDDFLGSCSISMERIVKSRPAFEHWISLNNVKHGEIFVSFKFCPTLITDDDSLDEIEMSATDSRHVISVFIDHCVNLVTGKTNIFPKCRLSIGNEDWKTTSTKNKTPNPSFEEGFLFLSPDPSVDNLFIEVLDHRNGNLLGKTSLSIESILFSPKQQLSNCYCNLNQSANPEAKIVLSAKVYKVLK